MAFIDIHCHLDFYQDEEIPAILERARKVGVIKIINNGVNPKTNRKILELVEVYKEIKPALGFYPIDAIKYSETDFLSELEFIKKNKNKIVAIGEVGLDFKEDETNHEKQKQFFERIIKLAKEIDKPLIVHSRKAEQDCVRTLETLGAKKVVMHCFSGNMDLVDRIIKNSWFLSIPTSVKHSEHFQNVIKITPITQLLCETDSPFLHPDKEKNNEPKNVLESYKKIAELKQLSLNEVEKTIEKNYNKLFG